MSVLLSKAEPALTVSRTTTIYEVVREMARRGVGAALVVEGVHPVGIFTSRDLMTRVVLRGLDPKQSAVGDAMTSTMITVAPEESPDAAMQRMLARRVRHLPIVDADGRVLAMLTMRRLLEEEADVLRSEVTGLEDYAGYDGATG